MSQTINNYEEPQKFSEKLDSLKQQLPSILDAKTLDAPSSINSNAKILLPSRLTFGENGSSNKKVARNTPLVYELKILDLNQK